MFTKKDTTFFLTATLLVSVGYTCMIADPAPRGFGFLTLWLAPWLLILGFLLPAIGIIGPKNLSAVAFFSELKRDRLKHSIAFLVFILSLTIYLLTLEPTASLWDCGEFIACAYKLQVPHSPGTPMSLLIGRLFSMLALGDVQQVAWYINMMSGLFSALTAYMVYYIIYAIGEKCTTTQMQVKRNSYSIIFAAAGGSLCLTFSDSFWFSAVEAEIYGMACFSMITIFWLALKGNDMAEPRRSRICVLIAYLAGLSFCIHPMCLLIIPALMVLWFGKGKAMPKIIFAALAGMAVVFIINRFIAIGLFELAFAADRFLVNTMHMPFYLSTVLLIAAGIILFIVLLKKFKQHTTVIWSIIFLMLGFLPYGILLVRSNHNPPIDENNPENLAMMKAYMNRESYPSSPLLYGPYFDAQVETVEAKRKVYYKSDAAYAVAGTISEYHYEQSRQTILPRLYSRDPEHIPLYRQWTGLTSNEKPKFVHNLKFMFSYQLGYMYLRYLMWNFAGREGEAQNSTWLKPWDAPGSSTSDLARNQYWMIPLLLGIAGAFYHYQHNKKTFFSNLVFFLITGIVLAFYLNSPPSEPRARDYIYVGSYIAFSIWVGLGILSLSCMPIKKHVGLAVTVCVSISLPLWMAIQNYDDHDRSGRTFQVDNAKLTLNSCAPGAILFTGGDNDTFPLWYAQEVEGFRTDVRVVVLSYFNTDWYIHQLKNAYYDSKPFRLTLGDKDYRQYGLNDVLYVDDRISGSIDVKRYLDLLKEEHPALTIKSASNDAYHILPSRNLKLQVGEEDLIHKISLQAPKGSEISREMNIRVNGNYLEKNALAVLDLMVSNQWERPMYFNFTSMNTIGIDIKPYLVQEGVVWRLLPVVSQGEEPAVNLALSYENLINKGTYANLSNPDIHFNYEHYHLRMIVPIQQAFNELAAAYLRDGDTLKAENVLQTAVTKLYFPHLKPSYTNLYAADMLIALGKNQLAESIARPGFDHYYHNVAQAMENQGQADKIDRYLLQEFASILNRIGDSAYLTKLKDLDLALNAK